MQMWQVADWWRSRVGHRARRVWGQLRGTRTATFRASPELEDLGSPVRALTITIGVITQLPDGTVVGCAAPQGTDAALNVCDASDGARLLTMPTSKTAGVTAMVTAADASVVLGSYHGGQLFRWVPGTERLDLLGRASPRADFVYGLSAAPDGRVFGGTYPDASFFSWSPDTGLRTLGRIRDRAITYVRSTATDGHTLWLGTMPEPRLYRYDLASGELTRVELEAPADASGVMALTVSGGLVFAHLSGALRVVDADTGSVVAVENDLPRDNPISSSVLVPDRSERVWFTYLDGDQRHRLGFVDPRTRHLRLTYQATDAGPLIGGAADQRGIVHAFAGNYAGKGVAFDPDEIAAAGPFDTRIGTVTTWDLQPAPAALSHVLAHPDRERVFVSAYVNGATAQVDLATGEARPLPRLGQVESWTMVDGRVWSGSYPGGDIRVLDPDQPNSVTNPEHVATLKKLCQQIRPVSVTRLGDDLWWACVPDYGNRGGALVRVGIEPGPDRVSWWRPLVRNHSLSVVVADQQPPTGASSTSGRLWVGTSRLDGTLATAVGGSARLVVVDPRTADVVTSLIPVGGATSITAITVDRRRGDRRDGDRRDGDSRVGGGNGDRLLVLADDTLVAVDLSDGGLGRVLARRWLDVPNSVVPGSGSVVVTDEAIMVSVGQRLIAVDPRTLEPLATSTGVSRRLVRSHDGELVSLVAVEDGADPSPTHVGRWLPRRATPE